MSKSKSKSKKKKRAVSNETAMESLIDTASQLQLVRTGQQDKTSQLDTLNLATTTTNISGSVMSDVAVMPADPTTMIGGTNPAAKPEKKKKSKKSKVSSAEKAKAKLDKDADELRKSGQPFQNFVSRMDIWLGKNSKRAIDLFRKFDIEGEGVLAFEEIKPGLLDLGIPCNGIELHLLCQIFDKYDNEEVDYLDISKGMAFAREQEAAYTSDDIRPSILLTDRNLTRCSGCKMARWDGESYKQQFPRFVEVTMTLVTFESFRDHPCHVKSLVPSHMTVSGLCQLVCDQTQVVTSQMVVFTDRSRDVRFMLMPHRTLEECNYLGGTQDDPQRLTLYYDYKVDFKDCPLLLCDHYFGQKVKT